MALKIPSSFYIGGHKVTARTSSRDCYEGAEELFGKFDPRTHEIVIHPDQRRSSFIDTFFHEFIEAANHFYDMEMPHQTIQTLAVAMQQLFDAIEKESAKCPTTTKI